MKTPIKKLTFNQIRKEKRLPELIQEIEKRLLRLHEDELEDKSIAWFFNNKKCGVLKNMIDLHLKETERYRMLNMAELATKIRGRAVPHDVFITPKGLAKKHIDIVFRLTGYNKKLTWFDPFRGTGHYYDQFPDVRKKYWTEITDGRNFFDTKGKVDVIISNPPYSCITKVLEHTIKLRPTYISYLISVHNMTNKRMQFFNDNGYGLIHLYRTDIHRWFGTSSVITFQKGAKNMDGFEFDLMRWKNKDDK